MTMIVATIVANGRCTELGLGLTEGHPLEQPKEVPRSEHSTKRRNHHKDAEHIVIETRCRRIRGNNCRELTPETSESGQTQRRHHAKTQDPTHSRHRDEHAAETLDLKRVIPLFHRASDEEQHASDEAVRDHSKDGGVESERGQSGNSQHDEAHVCNRAECDETFHVGLREASECSVDDADNGESADPRSPRFGGRGQDRNCDTHESVRSEFQQDGCQDYRALSWCLSMRVGEPCMEREHRHLDRETDEHACEDPDLYRLAEQPTVFGEVRDAEAGFTRWHLARYLEVQGQERNEHQRRPKHRIEEELQRGVLAVFAAPDADHEVHRQQHQLEEHEEQNEILSHKRAGHADLQHEHQHEKGLGVTGRGNVIPGVDHHQHRDHHAEDVQRQAEPVDSNGVVAVDHFDPRSVGKELQLARTAVVELRQGVHAHHQCGKCGQQRGLLQQQFFALGDEHHDEHTGERQEGADRK